MTDYIEDTIRIIAATILGVWPKLMANEYSTHGKHTVEQRAFVPESIGSSLFASLSQTNLNTERNKT